MGLFSKLFRRQKELLEGNVAFIGLSFAGKTTILNRLRTQEFEEETLRTMGLNVDFFEYKGVAFSAFDLGGQASFRMIWEPYLKGAFAVVYVIDSSAENFDESAQVLHQALHHIPENATLLLLANKSDLAKENVLGEIIEAFKFKEMQETAGLNHINLFFISAKTGDQFNQAFDWLAKSVEKTIRNEMKN